MARKPRNGTGEAADAGNINNGIAGTSFGAGDVTDSGTIIVNPAEFANNGENNGGNGTGSGDTTGEPVRKRRGRKPGSRNKTSEKPLDINGVEFILLSTHDMLAAMVKAPAMSLDKEEANKLATAISNVARHYDITATQKTLDWTALFMALGMVYGPRIAMMSLSRKKRKEEKAEVSPSELPGSPFIHQPGQVQ